jgi:hypothetical protein
MSHWLLTLIFYLQTPVLTQETSQIYDFERLGTRKDVAYEMGDLYQNINQIEKMGDLNVNRELYMIHNDTITQLPNFELYADSISLWQQKTQDLSYNIYNPMISHGANITTFFDFTEHMNGFISDYRLTYQLNMENLASVNDWSFCKNYSTNQICQCFPMYLAPAVGGA